MIGAIRALCGEADRIALKSQRSYGWLIEFALITAGVGLTTNLIAGYDSKDALKDYVQSHFYSVAAASAFMLVGISLFLIEVLTERRLP